MSLDTKTPKGYRKSWNGSMPPARGVDLIAEERARQMRVEGWDPQHDDAHVNGELATAAVCYATLVDPSGAGENAEDFWPWEPEAWKPSEDPIRNLQKAGALIAAEIDRLQRLRRRS